MALLAALKVDGAGLILVAVERAAGEPGDLLIVDDGLPVLDYLDLAPNQGNVEGLPDIGAARQLRRGCKEAVYPASVMTGRFCDRIGLDLYFVTPSKIDTAIGVRS